MAMKAARAAIEAAMPELAVVLVYVVVPGVEFVGRAKLVFAHITHLRSMLVSSLVRGPRLLPLLSRKRAIPPYLPVATGDVVAAVAGTRRRTTPLASQRRLSCSTITTDIAAMS